MRRVLPLAVQFASVTLTAAYAYGTTRFRVPAEPALCILAESHISAHTWPELGSAVFDVFTCGDTARPEVACALLVERLAPAQHSLQRVDRGLGIAVPVGA